MYLGENCKSAEFIRVKVLDCCRRKNYSKAPVLYLLRQESGDCVHMKAVASPSFPEGN